MAVRVTDHFPGGNVKLIERRDNPPEIIFTAECRGSAEALWFHFRAHDGECAQPAPATLKLTLLFMSSLLGGTDPLTFKPVFREQGKNWQRFRQPDVVTDDDGQQRVSWDIPYPVTPVEVAFSIPYGRDELSTLLDHCKGYWTERTIGLSSRDRLFPRLSNPVSNTKPSSPNPHGLLVVARQHAGETPGSWVMDGMLEAISRAKPANWCVWAIPFANLDDVMDGAYGKDPFPYDVNRAWGDPPMRRENMVMQQDISRWSKLCNPAIVVDLHAPGACETGGVYSPQSPSYEGMAPELEKATKSWNNVINQALLPEYAAKDFQVILNYKSRWETPHLRDYAIKFLKCPAVTLEIPYATIGNVQLLQKQFREIGQRVARAIISRW